MQLSTAHEWLHYIDTIHPQVIQLGLERVQEVARRLHLLTPFCRVIIVGGTNGKGSCVTTLAAIYQASGYRVGTFTSPALFNHNEQVKINNKPVSDTWFCHAFAAVENARAEISLTAFEFFTLAALWIFDQHELDVMILEVGLGGRLDAVNIFSADASVVTSIDLDHTDWLGPTREHIGFEKSGIYRTEKFAICGDPNPPNSLCDHANKISAKFYQQQKDFYFAEKNSTWDFQFGETKLENLPRSTLLTQNMATALATITLLQEKLPVNQQSICDGMRSIYLPARLQEISGTITEIYDVAHNPAAIKILANYLQQKFCDGKTFAVFSMLADKDISQCIQNIDLHIDHWFVAPLKAKRSASETILRQSFEAVSEKPRSFNLSVKEAFAAARKIAAHGDRIVVFGSFHTIAEVNE